jgi:hypothetical protein
MFCVSNIIKSSQNVKARKTRQKNAKKLACLVSSGGFRVPEYEYEPKAMLLNRIAAVRREGVPWLKKTNFLSVLSQQGGSPLLHSGTAWRIAADVVDGDRRVN